jgi:hypothetical protein
MVLGKVSLLFIGWELGDLEAVINLVVEKKCPVPHLLYKIKQNNDNCEHSHTTKARTKERHSSQVMAEAGISFLQPISSE